MKYPGSISLTEPTYRALLVDICASFRTHGFKHIVLTGGNTANGAIGSQGGGDPNGHDAGSGGAVRSDGDVFVEAR